MTRGNDTQVDQNAQVQSYSGAEISNTLLTNLSAQLVTIALTAITLLSGLFIFVRDKDNINSGFVIFSILALFTFTLSSIYGALGITSVSNYFGNPTRRIDRAKFSYQAILLYFGVAFTITATLFVPPNKDSSEIDRISLRISELEAMIKKNDVDIIHINDYLLENKKDIEEINGKIQLLEKSINIKTGNK